MSRKSPSKSTVHFTARDYQLLTTLRLGPFDSDQLCRLSASFDAPYTDRRFVSRRLRKLREAGVVASFPAYSASVGGERYHKLTRLGYRLVSGRDSPAPKRSFFAPTSLSLMRHTTCVADVIVATSVGAHRLGLPLAGQTGDFQLTLSLGKRTKKPDHAFSLVTPERRLTFFDEVDLSTEPITSARERESLQSLVRFYEDYRNATGAEFVVRVFFAGSERRIERFLEVAAEHAPTRRHLFLAARLEDYVTDPSPLSSLLFRDHDRRQRRCYKPGPAERRKTVAARDAGTHPRKALLAGRGVLPSAS